MATDTPVAVLVARFPQEEDARVALTELTDAKKQGDIAMQDAAVLRRDPDRSLHISDSADKGFGKGALIGGVAGAAVGVLAGPVGWATLGGAAVGGLAHKLRDRGFPDEKLKQMGESVTPGSAALVVVVDDSSSADVELRLGRYGAQVAKEVVSSDIATALDSDAFNAQQAQH